MAANTQKGPQEAIDLTGYRKMTPRQLLGTLGKLSIASWLWLLGLIVAVAAGGFGAGYSVGFGVAPSWTYAVLGMENSVALMRADNSRREALEQNLSDRFLSPEILRAVVPAVKKEYPDGLEDDQDARTSLVWQLRAFGGKAYFLSGSQQHSLLVSFDSESIGFEWPEESSLLVRIMNDHFPGTSEEELRQINSAINREGFAIVDNAVIFRESNGGLSLIIAQ